MEEFEGVECPNCGGIEFCYCEGLDCDDDLFDHDDD